MPSDPPYSIKVTGGKELRRALKNADKELKQDLKAANKAAAQTVADAAKSRHVPVDSGNLKAAISALGSATKGTVKAGKKSNGTQDYAGVIHYGDPNRGRAPQPFLHDAMSDEWDVVYAAYEKALKKITDKLSSK